MAKVAKVKRGLPKGPNGGVELLLIQTVEHLGKQGDVVEVRAGYAKNFLLPQGLATFATDHHKRMVEKHRAKLQEIQRVRLVDLRTKGDKIASEFITIEANATDEGHLYGSVQANDVSNALKAKGFTDITPDMVRLPGTIKIVGLYTVKIHLGHEIDAELKVWVVPTAEHQNEGQPQPPKA